MQYIYRYVFSLLIKREDFLYTNNTLRIATRLTLALFFLRSSYTNMDISCAHSILYLLAHISSCVFYNV